MSIEISPSSIEFSNLHQRTQFHIDEEILSCCASLIMRGTEVLDYKTYAFIDLESKRSLLEDAIYCMYLNTKLVTSVALMMLWLGFCDKAEDEKGRACSRLGRISLGRQGWQS